MVNVNEMEDIAVDLLEKGKLRQSEHVLKKMVTIDPNCLAAHFHLARVYRRTKEYRRALRHARRVLKLNPKERNASLNFGLIYDLLGKDKLAIYHYKKELLRNPHSSETLWNIGRLYFKRHQWLYASKSLRRCFEMGFEFDMEDTVYKLGFCYYKLRDLKSYIDVYTRYVNTNPNAPWAFANLGCALLRAKDYKGAILRLSRAHQLGVKESVVAELAKAKRFSTMRKNL